MRVLRVSNRIVSFVLYSLVASQMVLADDKAASPAISPDDQTNKVVSAANDLLGTLSDAEKSKALFKFNDEAQRLRWSNLPTGIFERKGLRMGDLKPEQLVAVMNVLKTTLSETGYQQIVDNVAAEETLNEGGRRGRLIFWER